MSREPNFEKGLIPTIIQDIKTGKVLMLGYMSQTSYDITVNTKLVTFFSRSKNRLWTKGETSGNFLKVEEILIDCDCDTILIKCTPSGPVCHVGTDTCFEEKNDRNFLYELERIITDRIENPTEHSYTSILYKEGINKISQKVGEEAIELVIESKDNNDELFLNESADLLFHYLILLKFKGHCIDDVIKILKDRNK